MKKPAPAKIFAPVGRWEISPSKHPGADIYAHPTTKIKEAPATTTR